MFVGLQCNRPRSKCPSTDGVCTGVNSKVFSPGDGGGGGGGGARKRYLCSKDILFTFHMAFTSNEESSRSKAEPVKTKLDPK